MVRNGSLAKKEAEDSTDYTRIANSPSFQELLKKKYAFIIPMSIFFMVFYFTLPVLTSYTTFLNKPAIGSISWAWLFASAQFIMTWSLCMIYSKRAAKFDVMVEKIIQENKV